MVDYSKWNNFEVSDSEDEDDEPTAPRVTRLEDGAKIQIGPTGSTVFTHPSSKEAAGSNSTSSSKATRKYSGKVLDSTNGGICETFAWSQDRYEATLQVTVPIDTKAADITFAVTEKHLSVQIKHTHFFGGDLAYAIAIDEDDIISRGIIWELSDYSETNRLLVFSLVKKSPIQGSFIWWKHVFPADPEVCLAHRWEPLPGA